jgi:glycosyltransferase involved in cell wall biosynthesis
MENYLTKKMNILIVRPMISQAQALMTQDCNLYALSVWENSQDPNLTERTISQNKNINWISWFPKKNSIFSFFSKCLFFRDIIIELNINIIHLNGLRDILAAFVGRTISFKNVKLIATSHNPSIWLKEINKKFITLFFLIFVDGVLTISSKNRNDLILNGYSKEKIFFTYNAFFNFELDEKIKDSCRKIDFNKLIYVASIEKRKSQLLLISVLEIISKKYPSISLELIGSIDNDHQYYHSIKEKIKEYSLEKKITIRGVLPFEEVIISYETCGLVLFPSTSEMMPRAVIEAMWLGKPVVASGVDGILDLITDRKTGLLCKPGDVKGFSDALQFLIENPNEAERIGKAGQEFVHEFCSLEAVGKKTIEFYNVILKN